MALALSPRFADSFRGRRDPAPYYQLPRLARSLSGACGLLACDSLTARPTLPHDGTVANVATGGESPNGAAKAATLLCAAFFMRPSCARFWRAGWGSFVLAGAPSVSQPRLGLPPRLRAGWWAPQPNGAVMINSTRSVAACDNSPLDGELTVIIRSVFSTFIGSRSQIVAEGVVPPMMKWPQGFNSISWEAAGLIYRLKRQRPEGAKGPRRAFLECDNWALFMFPIDDEQVEIARKSRELALALQRLTPEWQEQRKRQLRLYYAACEDEKFQAFKALIPGLIPHPRQRCAKKAS